MNPTIEREGMSLEAFMDASNEKFEIIHDEKVRKVPTVQRHGYVIRALMKALVLFLAQHPPAELMIEETFILPEALSSQWVKGSRIPDMMFYTQERYSQYITRFPEWGDMPMALVPDLVVEVASENDVASDVLAKVDLYLQDGVRMIWLVDPKKQTVWIFRASGDRLTTLHSTDILSGEDLIEGFTLPVSALFV